MDKIRTFKDLACLRESLLNRDLRSSSKTITISGGTCGEASGSLKVMEAIRKELLSHKSLNGVRVRLTGCHGFCEVEPIVIVNPSNVLYCRVRPEDAAEIVSETVDKGEIVERLLYKDSVSDKSFMIESDIPFFRGQDRILLGWNRLIDPRSIEDFIANDGYFSIAQVLEQNAPEAVIVAITASGLSGRGGGGFSTGRKWSLCRAAKGDEKYVICNADEGDPGAYMDRSILEGNPHLVLEGMLIGAWAIGAEQGYIYVRNEYPLALENARSAIKQARELGLLGDNILGSELCFDVEIARGGGAFVCGESTALMASLEGRVGEPRPKDVHTVKEGLWNKPTCLNNVETWANVPLIIKNGADWFANKGTEGSKGTKIFALTGKVRNTGLIEVPFGTPLSTIIYDIGGGAPEGSEVKAVQTGGPSGGCLPADRLDLPVDFETLAEAGSMVGSGGMVVMDQRTCMVDVAKYFLEFLQDESCGKCVPCRIGIDRMLEIVTDITEGRGRTEQLELLEDLAETVCETSLCALGKTAPNPVLSTLRYFRAEYEKHIEDKCCPAGVCRELIEYTIDADKCEGCGRCVETCSYQAIEGQKKQPHVIDSKLCRRCGVCMDICKLGAIKVA